MQYDQDSEFGETMRCDTTTFKYWPDDQDTIPLKFEHRPDDEMQTLLDDARFSFARPGPSSQPWAAHSSTKMG